MITAMSLLARGIHGSVAILDCDAHFGNGTAAILTEDRGGPEQGPCLCPPATACRPHCGSHVGPAAASKELVSLLMDSLYEAIVLVVIVALVGFWDWRAAMLVATSIPLTLAMSFGIVHVLGIDIQQVSIATLIIALGLLVDMPVVAGDAIKRELGSGSPRDLASWIGPTKLAKAIVFSPSRTSSPISRS